jgi:glycosyltransferase involved in cell wall biosynthesis
MNFELSRFILTLRPDLQKLFALSGKQAQDVYCAWLITSGKKEYQAVNEDPQFLQSFITPKNRSVTKLTRLQELILIARPDVREAFPMPEGAQAFKDWFYTRGLEEHDYWDFLSLKEKAHVLGLPEPCVTRLEAVTQRSLPSALSAIPFKKRESGVNLIGYAFGRLGIGEDLRMAGKALLHAQVPMTMLDFPPGDNVDKNERSMARYVSDTGELAFNIFCLTAEETGRFYAERGRSQFMDRYNIGYWPWELGAWPKEWEMMLELVDEVWVSTQHTYDALKPICKKPLQLMPMAVELGPIKKYRTRNKARESFKLNTSATLFCFAFDLNSHIERKNPMACVQAFLKAFPKADYKASEVGLVVKVQKPRSYNEAWFELKKIARSDRRIRIIEQTLDRPTLLALYGACDCYVSLHRAEGFGRGMAEALQLGLHVICTGYSGNVDFCQPPYADLVKYRLVRVKKGQYPRSSGQVWAEPSVRHAVQLMRQFYENTKLVPEHGTESMMPPIDCSIFSPELVGERYKKRLNEIWARRNVTRGAKKIGLAFASSDKSI